MDMNLYQAETAKTETYPEWCSIQTIALHMGEEVGEVQAKVRRLLHASTTPEMFADSACERQFAHAIAGELGDVLYEVASMARRIGYTLNEVASMNLDKITRRVKNGTVLGSGDDR